MICFLLGLKSLPVILSLFHPKSQPKTGECLGIDKVDGGFSEARGLSGCSKFLSDTNRP